MNILRTPDERFQNLPGFAYAPNYMENLPGYEGLRFHYVDEGPRDAAQVFLCLHGEPTWSYLYRRMIPVFTEAGHRVVAPDYFGFGRSDKPVDDAVYTFTFHRDSLMRFIERLDLRAMTLVCQDWGALLGLTLPIDMPGRFERLLMMNGALATGDVRLNTGFLEWRAWTREHPDMDIAKLMERTCPHLTAEECAAYAAPFPDQRIKPAFGAFPTWFQTILMPTAPPLPDARGTGGAMNGAAPASWPSACKIPSWDRTSCARCASSSGAVRRRSKSRRPAISSRNGARASRPRRSKPSSSPLARGRNEYRLGGYSSDRLSKDRGRRSPSPTWTLSLTDRAHPHLRIGGRIVLHGGVIRHAVKSH